MGWGRRNSFGNDCFNNGYRCCSPCKEQCCTKVKCCKKTVCNYSNNWYHRQNGHDCCSSEGSDNWESNCCRPRSEESCRKQVVVYKSVSGGRRRGCCRR